MKFYSALRWVGLGVGLTLAGELLWAAQPPSPAAVRSLQRLAEQQGHPRAAVRDLTKLGQTPPKEIEAAAAGVKPDALRRAKEQGGPLPARLEIARAKKFSAEQSQRIVAAERELVRQVQSLRTAYQGDVASAAGLPQAKVQQALARDRGEPEGELQVLAQLEKLRGRRLTASEANRVRDARNAFRDGVASKRDALAREVGKIAGLPSWVVKELLP